MKNEADRADCGQESENPVLPQTESIVYNVYSSEQPQYG